MDGDKIQNKRYLCCFCNTFIESSDGDPCEIDILINITKPKNQQYNQIFYCHINCFKKQLHEQMQSYFYLECLIQSKNSID